MAAQHSSALHSAVISVQPGQSVTLAANAADMSFLRDGADLVVSHESGTTLYKGFFAQGEDKPLPSLVLADGETVSGEDFLRAMNPDMDLLSTAAGPAPANTPGSGSGDYADDPGNLIGGVDALGTLGGLGPWGGARPVSELPEASPLAESGPAAPGAAVPPVGPTEPPVAPEAGGYYARFFIAKGDDASFSFRVHDAGGNTPSPLPSLGDITLAGPGAEYFSVSGINDDGTVTFVLTSAGQAALEAGEDIYGRFDVVVGDEFYPVLISGQSDGESYTASTGSGDKPVSEWYEAHGALDGATVELKDAQINSVVINSNEYREISVEQAKELAVARDEYWQDERYDPAKDPNGNGYHLVDKDAGFVQKGDDAYWEHAEEEDPDGVGSYHVDEPGYYWDWGGVVRPIDPGYDPAGNGVADGEDYYCGAPGCYWSDWGGFLYKPDDRYDPALDPNGEGVHNITEAEASFKGFIGVNNSDISVSGAGSISVTAEGGVVPQGASGTQGAGDASLSVVVGVKNSTLDAGADGGISITAKSGTIPKSDTVVDPDEPQVAEPYVNRVYGVHAGGFGLDTVEQEGLSDKTVLKGGTVSITASSSDSHFPAGGSGVNPPVDHAFALRHAVEEPGGGRGGQSVVGIMNQGYKPIIEYDEDGNAVAVGEPASVVEVEAQHITVEAVAESTRRDVFSEAVGIRNGSSANGGAPIPTAMAAFSYAPAGGVNIADASRGHTILRGQEGNTIAVSANAIAEHENLPAEDGSVWNSAYGLSAVGIDNVSGLVEILGADENDSISIDAKVSGNFGSFDEYGNKEGRYSATGIAVGEENRGGGKDAPVITISGDVGDDTLTITASADISLDYRQNEWEGGVNDLSRFGRLYGIRANEGALNITDVEHITIAAHATHEHTDDSDGTAKSAAWGVQVNQGAAVSMMETRNSDMAVKITSDDIGVEVDGGAFSASSGKHMDFTVEAGLIGLSAVSEWGKTGSISVSAAENLTMKVTVDGTGNPGGWWNMTSNAGGEYEPLVAAVAAQNEGVVDVSSGGVMDLTLTASSDSGTAYAVYADGSNDYSAQTSVTITSGDFNDTLSFEGNLTGIGGGLIDISTGGGNDVLTVTGDVEALSGWYGGTGGVVSIDTGADADQVTINGNLHAAGGRITIDTGTDNDTLTISGDLTAENINGWNGAVNEGGISITLGSGNDLLVLDGSTISGNVTLDGGAGVSDVLRYILNAEDLDGLGSLLDGLKDGNITGFEKIEVQVGSEDQKNMITDYINTNYAGAGDFELQVGIAADFGGSY